MIRFTVTVGLRSLARSTAVAFTVPLAAATVLPIAEAHAEKLCAEVGEPFDAGITKFYSDPIELYGGPEDTSAELGTVSVAKLTNARVDCRAPNLMVRIRLDGKFVGWTFGDEVEVDQTFTLSSGCPKDKETRVGATRGSGGQCG